jgi:hypothetical protein
MIDRTVIKIGAIVLGMQLLALTKTQVKRYIIREWFSSGEFGFRKWFDPNFILNLSARQIIGLGLIASFTILLFPLGIWLGSFKMGTSYPLTNMIGAVVNLMTFPLALYSMSRVLNEIKFNAKTNLGIGLIVLSKLIIIAGCWLMYRGGLDQ